MLRNTFIRKYVSKKNVLDLGFLGEGSEYFSDLHTVIRSHARSTFGVDIHAQRVAKAIKAGANAVCDDVSTLTKLKGKKFDVIAAGELLEHMSDAGLFLQTLKKHLNAEGIILITTPNILALRYMVRHTLLGNENPFWSNRSDEIAYGHVIGHTKHLLTNLVLREGFSVVESTYGIKDEYGGIKGNCEKFLSTVVPRFAPTLLMAIKVNTKK